MNTSYFIKANWPAPNNVIAGTTLRMVRVNKELKELEDKLQELS